MEEHECIFRNIFNCLQKPFIYIYDSVNEKLDASFMVIKGNINYNNHLYYLPEFLKMYLARN